MQCTLLRFLWARKERSGLVLAGCIAVSQCDHSLGGFVIDKGRLQPRKFARGGLERKERGIIQRENKNMRVCLLFRRAALREMMGNSVKTPSKRTRVGGL